MSYYSTIHATKKGVKQNFKIIRVAENPLKACLQTPVTVGFGTYHQVPPISRLRLVSESVLVQQNEFLDADMRQLLSNVRVTSAEATRPK
ncbi:MULTISPECIES: hypothetical protein [unclassified Mesorhizobium]|uniref:hypothetical protein n=1 Tax=unclassified Mesorhizobium TaxID=325217 RepID=UPI0013E3C021|nr:MULTISPECIES: hypothetical protein [unclassified Mesorhizobium]